MKLKMYVNARGNNYLAKTCNSYSKRRVFLMNIFIFFNLSIAIPDIG
jgi:hypothetical protein